MHYGKAPSGGFKFGEFENCNVVSVKAESAGESLLCVDPHGLEDKECMEKAICEGEVLPESHSPCPKITSVEENTKNEVHEVFMDNVKQQVWEKVVSQSILNVEHEGVIIKLEHEDSRNRVSENISRTVNKSMFMVKTKNISSELGAQVIGEPLSIGTTTMRSDTQQEENGKQGINEESQLMASVKDSADRELTENSEDLWDAQNIDVNNAEDAGESKERFRERLWCFLFENLNRAVDELYLLCELECDLDQMKEAGLVLEEAASDFMELKSRVEKFEKLKRFPSHGGDGAPLVQQSDHCRPHALSWEVRRMTTSPRRAEILSSSLEAFRKIPVRNNEYINITKNMVKSHSNFETKDMANRDNCANKSDSIGNVEEMIVKMSKKTGVSNISQSMTKERRNSDLGKSDTVPFCRGKHNHELHEKKTKTLVDHTAFRNPKSADPLRRQIPVPEREREKRNGNSSKSMDAWKEKRNWEDILASPHRLSSCFSYSPGMNRKSTGRVRILHDKLMSPEKKKKSALDLKKEAEEKHARATRIRSQLEHERVQKLQKTSEKLNRVYEWQTVRSNKLRESMFARHQRSESRHEAYLAQVARRAGDESSKVNEVRFITSMNEENKKLILRKKLQDSELRRAEKLQGIKIKQKEDIAREEAVLERKRLIEAEKLQRLAETQRRKEEAQVRKEEERKASSAAREAKAMEQMRRKEIRAKARQEEAELMAQKLAERLSESEQRRKFYLEQIREKASMDFRDQSSPLFRRVVGKDGQPQSKLTLSSNGDDYLVNDGNCGSGPPDVLISESLRHSLKRRIKKIRQRLMSLKHDFPEPSFGLESSSGGYRTAVATARGKIARWLQDLQKLRQARKEGAANFCLITAEMVKFLEGKDAELQATRQAGLLDFIASALPASHTSKPEACQVTVYLLRLVRIILVTSANKCYVLAQNLLPPFIPLLATALENYIKMAAALNLPGTTNFMFNKTSTGNFESNSEIVDGYLWTVAAVIGCVSQNEYQLQMQDGLVELIIAYQIIHRLRDLFALYDRPQVEGSPFPSSILLGINLLTVLTSRFKESSSIDWDSFTSHDMLESELGLKTEFPGSLGCSESSVGGWAVLPTTGSLLTDLSDVTKGNLLSEFPNYQATSSLNPVYDNSNGVDLSASKVQKVDLMCESLGAPTEDSHDFAQVGRNNSLRISSDQNNGNSTNSKHPATFLLSAISETGLVCLPSLLTAVLLQANNRLSAEQSSYVLPSNFEEVATGVLKLLNNLALMDITFIQKMLARPDLKMEFFHLMGFLLSHCTSNWGVATDKIGMLLLESLSLLSYFSLFHRENQAVLRWGKSPTILHKVCDLPFAFFSDPELMPVLAGTLVAASYGCPQNRAIIQQELSMDMLLHSLKSCKSNLPQAGPERKSHSDPTQRLNRNMRSSRAGGGPHLQPGCSIRILKSRNQREVKVVNIGEETHVTSETSTLMLHSRFPASFIDRVHKFFMAKID